LFDQASISVIIPAHNEAQGLQSILPRIRNNVGESVQILVVDDGSTDTTSTVAIEHGAEVVHHPQSLGNGAAVKSGARAASGQIAVFMDGDGQHRPEDIPRLIAELQRGHDMAVGARIKGTQASRLRGFANGFYNELATLMTGYTIRDLTSGFRAVSLEKFRRFLYLLPNGFSYPTTCTMAFFRSGYSVSYVAIGAQPRKGSRSGVRVLKDGIRFAIIILKIGSLYSPMRLFLPISATLASVGLAYYGYTYVTQGRFTNMTVLLFTTAITTFLIGIVSEQISALHYRDIDRNGN
jgi:glycosyltransferase involved in cell wall biosynthesis